METEDDRERYEGDEMYPEKDEDGVYHCGECIFNLNFWDKHSTIKLSGIQPNTCKNKNKYRYFARFITNIKKVED